MIDNESYKVLVDYLNNKKYEELKDYIDKEHNLYYLKQARENLGRYFNDNYRGSIYGYLDDKSILISDKISVYKLYKDEILSKYYKKKFKDAKGIKFREDFEMLYDKYNKYINNESYIIDKTYDQDDYVDFSNEDENITHRFSIKNLTYSRIFLGEDVKYKICEQNVPICIAESAKGNGIILGIRH